MKIPWNKGKKGLQVSWNKTPLNIENEIISLYKQGLSSTQIGLKVNKSKSSVCRILKRYGIKARSVSEYEKTEKQKNSARETLKKNLSNIPAEELEAIRKRAAKTRGEQLKLDIEHQRRAGRLGGLKTKEIQKSHPEILKPFIEAGKLNNPKLIKWKTENKDLEKKISSETAKKTHEQQPNLASRMGKSTQQKHPNQSSETAKLTHQKDPGLASRMGKSTHQKHPEQARQNAFKSIESQRKNRPWYWENVPFASKEEMEVAKLFLEKPVEGINVHIKIGWSLEVDFFPEEKVFIEYHPNLYGKSEKQYKAPRIKTLQNSKYKDKKIEFIFDSLKNNRSKFLARIKEIKEKYNIN